MTEEVILTNKPRKSNGTARTAAAAATAILATSYIPPADVANTVAVDATHKYEIGVDEAGRGPLFGRVYTGAVILPSPANAPDFDFSVLKDSKKFSSDKKIREVAEYIKQHNNMPSRGPFPMRKPM